MYAGRRDGSRRDHQDKEIDNGTEMFASDRTCSRLPVRHEHPALAQEEDDDRVHHPEAQAGEGPQPAPETPPPAGMMGQGMMGPGMMEPGEGERESMPEGMMPRGMMEPA